MWIAVVLIVSLFTLVLLAAGLASLVDMFVQLGRAAQRFQDEVGVLAADIARGSTRAGDHAGRLRSSEDSARR